VTASSLNLGRLEAIVEQSRDLMLVLDAGGIVEYSSPACAALLDDQIDCFEGLPLAARVHPEDIPLLERIAASVPGEFVQVGRLRLERASGGWAILDVTARNCLHEERVRGIVLTCRDVAQQEEMERRIRRVALEDVLTRLPTRNYFIEQLDAALTSGESLAVLSVDLDGFRRVNDYEGHDVGDDVLRTLGSRMRDLDRERMTVARVGGDQFMLFARAIDDAAAALQIASELTRAVSEEISIGDRTFTLSSTIGIALAPDHGRSALELIRCSEIAMTMAKSGAAGNALVFTERMRGRISERREAEVELRRGLANAEFHMVYQPEVRLDGGGLVALEALVRLPGYRHSTEHMIRAAEESRLIVPLGERVLELAVADAAIWNRAGRNVRLAVNISPEHVRSGSIGTTVEQVLERHGLPASQLELELTEHVVLEQSDDAIRSIGKLREAGVTIAIDDFGTGYSSLAYLRRFPVDKLKIDRAFVAGLTESIRDTALVDAMISVALKLGLSVVAEGIESPEQAEILRGMGCPLGQGYWFGRPVPAATVNWDTGAGDVLAG